MGYDFDKLFVFEMANNHNGSLDHGLHIIEEIAKITRRFGIRSAIKLQYRDIDTFIHPDFIDRKDLKHIPRFISTRLSWKDFQTLVYNAHEQGMLVVITAFDEKSVEKALNHGVDILKIASCSAMDWPLLEEVSRSGKPVICSTGGCTLSDIDKIVTFFEHRNAADLALLHCVGIYPTQNKDQTLSFMLRMIQRYPHCTVGYSGHESPDNLDVVRAVVAMGAKILERHVGVPGDSINLNSYSMNPKQTAQWVQMAIDTQIMFGNADSQKRVTEMEAKSLLELARGVYARRAITQGETLSYDAVFFAMPCFEGQTSAKEYLESMKASKDYACNEGIKERREYDSIQVMRSIVHEVKGMLREAKIAVGNDYQIELSHHYGIDNFRRIGATIVNFFNREYCKKLIILLPGQNHPIHYHKTKEETFQLLFGEMELTLDNEKIKMQSGHIHLIRREQPHAFSTKTGCVFEEISTTHVKGDSYYEDQRINQLDPVQRKTTMDSW